MDPWSIPEFRTGLGAGTIAALAALAIGGLAGRRWRPLPHGGVAIERWRSVPLPLGGVVRSVRRSRLLPLGGVAIARWRSHPLPPGGVAVAGRWSLPLPLGGVAVAAAGVWTISRARPVPAVLLLAVLGVAAVAAGRARWRWSFALSLALAAPFAFAAGFHAELPRATWVRVLVAVVASVGALLAAECDLGWRSHALGPPLLGLTLVGVYATVPDTEEAAGLLAAALPVVALGWPLRRLALGTGGAAGTTVLLAWTAAVGGVGRPASIVGAFACLGLLVGLPLGRRLSVRRARPGVLVHLGRAAVAPAALLAHLVLVAVGSRVAGLRDEVAVAASIATLVVLTAVVVGGALDQARADGPDRPEP